MVYHQQKFVENGSTWKNDMMLDDRRVKVCEMDLCEVIGLSNETVEHILHTLFTHMKKV